MTKLACFIIGTLIGCGVGFSLASLCAAARRADDQLERLMKKRQEAEDDG